MLPNPQPQSRWAAFIQRWDERLTRFRGHFDPSLSPPGRPMKTWAIVALSASLIVLAALIAFGTMWAISHHSWHVIWILLKMGKWFAVGIAIVVAIAFRHKFAGKAEPAKE